jgi:hypothetical protein
LLPLEIEMIKRSPSFAAGFFTLAVLVAPTVARANHPNQPSCAKGHWYFKTSETPMVETGGGTTITVPWSTTPTLLVHSCDNELSGTSPTMAYNVVMRYWLSFKSTTIPVGTPYQVELATLKNGVYTVQQLINRKVQHLSSEMQPHTEYLAAYIHGLTGENGYRIRMRFLTSGTGSATVDVGNFAAFQGSRQEFGGATNSLTHTITLDTTWREIVGVTMNNFSGGEVDVQLQGHLVVLSGTPGTGISIGIGRDMNSSGNHYSRAYVPSSLPEEITVLDYIPNEGVGASLLPIGFNTFHMWAKVDSGTITVNTRRLDVMGMDAAPAADTTRYYQFAGGPITLAEDTAEPQPQACILVDVPSPDFHLCNPTMVQPQPYPDPPCGRWTKLFEGSIPANPLGVAAVGAGHVEITGKSCKNGGTSCWGSGATRANVAIEMVTNVQPNGSRAAVDFHMSAFSVANLPMKIHFFSDGFEWGNDTGQTVRLWVRLIDYPCNAVNDQAKERRLTIGRSYLGIRFFYPTGTLYNPLLLP